MREIFMFLCFICALPCIANENPVFSFQVKNGSIHAIGKNGEAVAPLKQDGVRIESGKGIVGDALRADRGSLFYSASLLPEKKGSVEVWVMPLPAGCSPGFHFYLGGAGEWGPEGLPRLWFWESRPRFDVDAGPRLIAERLKDDSWKPGVWNHLAATYDSAGMTELYVNGELLTRKAVTPWKTSSFSAFAIGSGCSLGGNGRNYADALIDSVRIYDRILSKDEIAKRYHSVQMPVLFASAATHSVVTDLKKSMRLNFSNRGSIAFSGNIEIHRDGEKSLRFEKLSVAPGKTVSLEIPPPFHPKADGLLTLRAHWTDGPGNRTERVENVEFFVPPPAVRAVEAPVWKSITEIDAWKAKPASFVGDTIVCDTGTLRYREGGSGTHNRFAYTMRLPGRDLLLRVRVQVPDDKKRSMMISQSQPDFAHPRTCGSEQQVLGSGVLCGGEFPLSGKMLTYEYIFRQPSEYLALIFEGYAPGQPAAVGKITVGYAVKNDHYGPAVQRPLAASLNGRRSGLYWEDPVLSPCFGGFGGVSYPDFDKRVRAAMDYCDWTGQNLIFYPTVWYGGPLYQSHVERGAWPVGMRHHPPAFPRLLAWRCSERNIRFVATFNLWKLPSLSSLQCSPEEVVSGRDALNTVSKDGKIATSTNWHSQPHLNALRKEVQNAVEGLSDEHSEMYGDLSGFGGIGFALWMGVPMQLGLNLETSYDDWSMEHFAAYRKETLPGVKKSADRFKNRAEWILKSPERKSAFLKWRAGLMSRFYIRVAERIRKVSPDASLYLILVYPVPLKDSGKTGDRLLEQGLDLETLASHPAIRLIRMVNQTNLRQEEKWHKAETLPPRFLELTEDFQRPLLNHCFGAIVHQQYFESHGPLSRKTDPKLQLPPPWKQEALGRCTAPVPSSRNFLGYYANMLALFDAKELAIGGFTLGLHGVEEMAREWSLAFQSLPAVRFAEAGRHGNILLRSADAEGSRWFYLLNLSEKASSVHILVQGKVADCVSGKNIASGVQELRPYELRAMRTEKNGGLKIVGPEN